MTIELGRRERKKLERREEMLECAAGLFERHGFDGTSVEAIAEAADVSLRTFYNFFPTKLDVLVAVNILSIRERLGRALAELADPPRSPKDGLFKMVEAHFRAFDRMDRDLLIRGSIHGLVQGPRNAGGVDYAMYDAFSLAEIRRLVELYVRRGTLAARTDMGSLARLIFAAGNGEFFSWVVDREARVDSVLKRMRCHIDLAVAGSQSAVTGPRAAERERQNRSAKPVVGSSDRKRTPK